MFNSKQSYNTYKNLIIDDLNNYKNNNKKNINKLDISFDLIPFISTLFQILGRLYN